MTIYRDGKAIELTGEEIAQVVKESHLDFYRDELRDSFYVPESKYDDIAERAYELYCEGDGKTEYECLEEAVDELGKYTFEIWQDGCCIHEDIDGYGIWCGVKRIDEFENDNPMYIVSRFGGEAEAVLYHISEYDDRIGDFCAEKLKYWDFEKHCWILRTEQNWINCCAKMLADYLETHCNGVDEIITVDM